MMMDDENAPHVPMLPLEAREIGVGTKGTPIAHDDAESVSTATGWAARKQRNTIHGSDPMHLARGRHTNGERFSQPPTFSACRQRTEDFSIGATTVSDRLQLIATWTWMGKPHELRIDGLVKDQYSLRMVLIERCFASMT